MSFYENFIRLCNERGETPSSVARSIGVDKSAVTRWSKGAMPRGTTAAKLADHFGVTVGELLGYEKREAVVREPDVVAEVSPTEDGLEAALDALRNQPGRRALLSATKNMTEAQVLRMADWIADLTGGNKD